MGVLYPSLKEALGRAQRVVYVTPKNSQHSVAEDAIERFQDTGTAVRSLTITAKSKICFQNEPVCNPDRCEYARDYYKKVHEHGLIQKLAKKKRLRAKTFREFGEEYQVCPFELQIDAADDADVVICDYNYVFAPHGVLGKLTEAGQISGVDQEGKPNLVIDEAHNLPSRAMDYYSPAVSTAVLERMRPDIRELPGMFKGEAERILDECIGVVAACRPGQPGPAPIPAPAASFRAQDERVRGLVSRYLESAYEIQPRDVVLGLGYYWSAFTDALEFAEDPTRSEFFTTFQPHPSGGTVKITCCDASPMLEASYDGYEQVVGFSATLKPFDYYARLSGLLPEEGAEASVPLQTSEFASPFPAGNRKLLIIPQVSTKFSERARNYAKIAAGIARIAAVRPGNYFAFFPSFDFLAQVLAHLEAPPGFEIIQQTREMRAPQVEAVIERLRQPERPAIVFAVQGGVFSEGVDYPGDVIIGAFVIGPPLPSFDLEREQMREYYEREYGAGFDYAYAFPAMAKAVQAAGRVIRSETDRGLIVFMDSRFLLPSYSRSMPSGWFAEHPRELVSSRILEEVREFWG